MRLAQATANLAKTFAKAASTEALKHARMGGAGALQQSPLGGARTGSARPGGGLEQRNVFGEAARQFSTKARPSSLADRLTSTMAKMGQSPHPKAMELLSSGKTWSDMAVGVMDALAKDLPSMNDPDAWDVDVRGARQVNQMENSYSAGLEALGPKKSKGFPTDWTKASVGQQMQAIGAATLKDLHEKLDGDDSLPADTKDRIKTTLSKKFDNTGVGLMMLSTRPAGTPGVMVNGVFAGDLKEGTPESLKGALQAYGIVLDTMVEELSTPDVREALYHLGEYEEKGAHKDVGGTRQERLHRTTDLSHETTAHLKTAMLTGQGVGTIELGHIGFAYAAQDRDSPAYNGEFELDITDTGQRAGLVNAISQSPDVESILPIDTKLDVKSVTADRAREKIVVKAETLPK